MKPAALILFCLLARLAHGQMPSAPVVNAPRAILVPDYTPTIAIQSGPTTNGPAQHYWFPGVGNLDVQPMIDSRGRPYGELFISNSVASFRTSDRAVTNSAGIVVGWECDSYLPPGQLPVVITVTYGGQAFYSITNPAAPRYFRAYRSANLDMVSISDSSDLQNWTSGFALLPGGAGGTLSINLTNLAK